MEKVTDKKKNGDKVKKLLPWEDKKSLILQKPIWIKIYSGAIFFLCRKVKNFFGVHFCDESLGTRRFSRF